MRPGLHLKHVCPNQDEQEGQVDMFIGKCSDHTETADHDDNQKLHGIFHI